MTIYFMNGEYTEKESVQVSVEDRGYYFGDGVYEVIKVYSGELFTAEEHFTRLQSSAEKIRINLPYTVDEFVQIAEKLVADNGIVEGHVYMQVTRGVAARMHNFPGPEVGPMIMSYAIDNPRPLKNIKDGVAVKIVDDIRWLRCDIKSLNLLANVMAKQDAAEAGCSEAVFVREGIVTEGSSSNIFGIKNGVLQTHPATNLILNGITRRVILKCCVEENIEVLEEPFTLDQLNEMDEVFLSSTTSEITPIVTIDGLQVNAGVPGKVTKRLQRAFAKAIQQPVTQTT